MIKETGRSKPEGLASSPSAMLALGCIGLMASTSPVLAQDRSEPEQRLGGVTVTDTAIDESYNRTETASDKSTAPLLNTPQTISVIPQEVIRDRAARTLADVLRNTPGISFDAGENGFATSTNNFTLRGFDSSGNVFIDNSRDSGSYARDIFNVESVEVVKGAAADNGRGSAAGYVNINTKKPTLDGFVSGDISFGFDQYDSKSRKRGTIDINQPIGGTAAVRLNAVVEDSGVPGRDLARNKFWGVAPSVAVGLGTSLRAILSWEHLERDDRPDWGVPGATIRKKSFDASAAYNPLTEGAPRDGFYGLASDFDDTTADSILGRLEYDLSSAVTISNQTRWSRIKRASRFTNPTGFTPATLSVPTGTVFYDRVNKSISNITNLSAKFDTGGISHNLALGVEFTSEKSNADRLGAAVPAPGSTSLFDPDPIRVGAAPFNATQTARVKVDTLSFYLYDTIEFSEQFQITGGIRGENYEVEIDSLTAAGLPTGAADSFKRDKFSFSGKVGLVFKPVEAGSFYASFGTSTLPPGSYLSNPDISRTGDNAFPGFVPDAKQVRSHNYEIGLKWDFFDGALSTTAALFRTEKRNVPVVGRLAGETADSLQGYHKQVVEGIELSATGQITPAWNIFGGMLIMDSKRKISQALDDARRAGASGSGDYGAFTSTNGDRLAFTPNFSATMWTSYELPFGLTVGAGVQHTGSRYLGRPDDALRIIPNGRYGKLPSFTVFNALLSYDVTENIDVRLNVDNIANKKYALSTNWNGSRATLGAPRTWLVSAGFRF
ncbi:TonB-dependent receptor [Tsuneonella sp. CC-YZS046]|uniref:TonB-dependent receptor n=1 Tax=Tsuneonella sp. CC-YZS046 TaxID=3042152 RepID=UPI002D771588|nr:TonB-dependent receptor [Tsuneonella sp. CC-YZS046]WRO68193.1 TonB-dependent receptor [Tsuneonella sp. CC-YZS046]